MREMLITFVCALIRTYGLPAIYIYIGIWEFLDFYIKSGVFMSLYIYIGVKYEVCSYRVNKHRFS